MPPVPGRRVTAEAWITAPYLLALVTRVVSHYQINQEDGEDLLQETRIALWEAGQEVVGAAWVTRVASHKAVDLVRGRVRARAHIRTYAALPEGRRPEPEIRAAAPRSRRRASRPTPRVLRPPIRPGLERTRTGRAAGPLPGERPVARLHLPTSHLMVRQDLPGEETEPNH